MMKATVDIWKEQKEKFRELLAQHGITNVKFVTRTSRKGHKTLFAVIEGCKEIREMYKKVSQFDATFIFPHYWGVTSGGWYGFTLRLTASASEAEQMIRSKIETL